MKCLTIVTAMSGHGGHGLARKIAEHNPDYRWYDHPRNDQTNPRKFPELNLAGNHFRKRFKDNSVFPHLFDRIENLISDKELYYSIAEKEIKDLSLGKQLVYVCHEIPSVIKNRFPKSTVIQILPTRNILENVIDRHMITHMEYPVQSGIHNLPGRKNLMNEYYWSLDEWSKINLENSLINFRSYYQKKSLEEIKYEERVYQRQLYEDQLSDTNCADISMVVETVEEALEQFK
jgi:hypothetical protein